MNVYSTNATDLRDRHQRLLRTSRRRARLSLYTVAPCRVTRSPGFPAELLRLLLRSTCECHNESLPSPRHRASPCVQRGRGSAWSVGLHHDVAAGADPAASSHAERLRRSCHQQYGNRAHHHGIHQRVSFATDPFSFGYLRLLCAVGSLGIRFRKSAWGRLTGLTDSPRMPRLEDALKIGQFLGNLFGRSFPDSRALGCTSVMRPSC